MDLSMILSPAVEEEEEEKRPPPPEPDRKWSADELQCAVAILQDFQQPPPAVRSMGSFDAPDVADGDAQLRRYYEQQEREYKQEGSDNDEEMAKAPFQPARSYEETDHQIFDQQLSEEKESGQAVPGSVWGEDCVSKLDLLVQADAVIKRRRPPPSSSSSKPQKPPQYLRSGVWTKAEEEYAAALMYYFLKGLLVLQEGTTLRKFLAEQLCCNRRRVSMKLATEALANKKIPRKVGASVFVALQPPPGAEERQEIEEVLAELRHISFSTADSASGLETSHRQQHRARDDELEEILQEKPHVSGARPQRTLFKTEEGEDEYEEDRRGELPIAGFRLHQKPLASARAHQHNRDDRAPSKRKPTARNNAAPKRGHPTIIRTGFESPEEEEFVSTMFEYFMTGVLDLAEGTKLVTYLCEQLGCTPKVLSMKLAPRRLGERKFPDNVGTITYLRKETGVSSPASSDSFSEELFEVESRLKELRVACEEAHTHPPPPITAPVKRERKASTASLSSTGTASVSSTPSASPVRFFQRSGPWSREEEVYAASLIDCFFKGVLDIAEGTTLRAFLASRLCCNPMRISKKLASECIADIRIPKKLGSSTFVLRGEVTAEEQMETEEALRSLQHAYLHSDSSKDDATSSGKRPRSARGRASRSRPRTPAIDTDPDATESDSDAASSSAYEKSPAKLRKTERGEGMRRQRFQRAPIAHEAPERVVPMVLKQQVAYGN
ncbi:hypothetical protein BBJ28_00018571 [Nothophytophthora sp. Chile5]|nr:hypothetical protein BBJ28_00018571 [Nothophytophthora sp. Chile5]